MKHKVKHTKYRHGFFLVVFKVLFGPFLAWHYRFKAKKISIKKGGPYLILSNHTSEFDTIFMGLTFDKPLYFVASDQLLNSGFGSWFLRFFFNPIPKSKSMADLTLVKRMVKVIEEKGNVVLYPEGNSTMSGDQVFIGDAIGKLVKFLNLEVIFVNVKGLYLSSPRWSFTRKFGQTTLEEVGRLSKEKIASLSVVELANLVREKLDIHLYQQPQLTKFKGKKRAEGLHKLVFNCPSCKGIMTTFSQGDNLVCSACSFTGHYDDYGYLHINGKKHDLIELDKVNKTIYLEALHHRHEPITLTSSCDVSFWRVEQKRRSLFTSYIITINKDILSLKGKEKTLLYDLKEIVSSAIQVRTKLLIYLKDGTILLIRFPKEISPYAYLMTIQIYTHMFTLGGDSLVTLNSSTLGL